ncbi:Phosphinothricin N-acetyltransferase [Paenibacillus plantiphilus]|uniref:Phosphinothricin N-acetyltransferase n=1 Tax=Paenibacillus plantiphilus TaxID=2905650 RepID=A0ABM9CK19_9BACL|nr:Phosphinothricin N-acetyltransferase [Paenibacillus plantiphilus]
MIYFPLFDEWSATNLSSISFHEYTESYLEAVRHTYNYFVEHTTVSFDMEPLTTEQMSLAIQPLHDRYRSHVVCIDGRYAGYMLITQHKKKAAFNPTGEVTIYLNPEETGKGLGSHSLQFVEDTARELGFHSLIATICSENTASISLFTRYGYEQAAHYKEVGFKFGRWLDIVTYQKLLNDCIE